jgi:hypothetical protein
MKNVQVVFTEEEAKFVLSALDRVPLQGLNAARLLTLVAEKLAAASRFAFEKQERVRAPLDQALLARVQPLDRTQLDVLPKPPNGKPENGEKPCSPDA